LNRFAVAVGVALCVPHAASAGDGAPATPDAATPDAATRSAADQPAWALQVTPYVWATGISGRLSPFRRAPTVSVDRSFTEGLDDVNFAGFANLWARRDRFVFSGDIMYTSTTDDDPFGNLPPLPAPVPPGTKIKGHVDTKQLMATLQGGYRVVDTPAFTLDALGGVRFWHIYNEVKVSALGMSRAYDESFGWVDPVIGARAFVGLTDELSIQAQADIGGFGAGSDLTWSALATANYTFTDSLSVSAGYKVLDVDYEKGGRVYDNRLSGPVLGLTYRF